MAKQSNYVSSYFRKEDKKIPELMVRESYLRTVKELLDGCGVSDYAIEQIRGATTVLEKFVEIEKEND